MSILKVIGYAKFVAYATILSPTIDSKIFLETSLTLTDEVILNAQIILILFGKYGCGEKPLLKSGNIPPKTRVAIHTPNLWHSYSLQRIQQREKRFIKPKVHHTEQAIEVT